MCESNPECASGLLAPLESAVMISRSAALPQEEQSKEEQESGGASAALRQQGLMIV